MRVIIAGGGTGGHLFPGMAVAEELKARGHEITFVGTQRGIEARACPKEGWPLELIDVGGLKGAGALGVIRGLLRVPRAVLQSVGILRRIKPDLVIGVGGYASGPVVMAAALSGRPTAILEQNSVPGITNRMLGRMVGVVFGAFDAARRFFPRAKFRLVGNPVRTKLRDKLAETSTRAPAGGGLLVVGGSQGAHAVNELVLEAMKRLAQNDKPPRLLHQSGEKDHPGLVARYKEAGIDVDVRAFIDDMAGALAGCELAVTRAGASTLAELTALGVPAILIPFPQAADDHQTVNARELEERGAAKLMPQKELTPETLARAIRALLDDEPQRRKMAEAARSLGKPRAHADIADQLEALVRSERRLPEGTALT